MIHFNLRKGAKKNTECDFRRKIEREKINHKNENY